VVEDDPQVGPWLVLRLSTVRPDLRVLLAADGFRAGELVATEKPDLMLLDIYLPGLDGFEVCRRVKAARATAGIRVIAMSANDTPEVRATILAAGAAAFLPKPIDFGKLLTLVPQPEPATASAHT
jgi:DNA-binding response OmpR family regulator